MDLNESVYMFKVLSDENRIRIIELLRKKELCACTILESLTIKQSTLSHHMKLLVDSGLVSSRKDGKWIYYSLSREKSDHLKKYVIELMQISEDYAVDKCDDINTCKQGEKQ